MSKPRRERRSVLAVEEVGPYALVRLERGGLEPGTPGQFFMLEAPGRVLPRPMSLCLAPPRELGFLLDPIGPGTRALAELEPGDAIHVLGPLGNGFRLDVARPVLVGGGIGIAPLPYLSEALERPPAVLGFRSAHHAEAAVLVPNAEVVIDPVFVIEVLPEGRDVLACGPEPMLEAVRALCGGAATSGLPALPIASQVILRRIGQLSMPAVRLARCAMSLRICAWAVPAMISPWRSFTSSIRRFRADDADGPRIAR